MSRSIKASHAWYKDHEDKKKREGELLASMYIFDELRDILEEVIQEERNASEQEEHFEKPNWDLFFAQKVGSIRALKKLRDMLPSVNEKANNA